jgi:hypothetical protein
MEDKIEAAKRHVREAEAQWPRHNDGCRIADGRTRRG